MLLLGVAHGTSTAIHNSLFHAVEMLDRVHFTIVTTQTHSKMTLISTLDAKSA